MHPHRLSSHWLAASAALFGVALCAGCAPGSPGRASDIQNVNGITDDIAAVHGTRTDFNRSYDPNYNKVIPTAVTGPDFPPR